MELYFISLLFFGCPRHSSIPPIEACMIHSKQHRGCRVQDPGTRGYRWWRTADFSHSAGTAHGASPSRVVRDGKGMQRRCKTANLL